MNKLYWMDLFGNWELILESDNEVLVMEMAKKKVNINPCGVCGYAFYAKAPTAMAWTEYDRHLRGYRKCTVSFDQLPKPIRLLEMLLCKD